MDYVSRVLMGIFLFMCLYLFWMWFCFGGCIKRRQKTRNPQRRRIHRTNPLDRRSLSQQEPTIYVSPSNLPPPPKYEALAPPSYEEVVGIHYPNYQSPHVQPITQPITTALAQTSNVTANESLTNSGGTVVPNPTVPLPVTASIPAVVTVANERRTSLNA